MSDEIGLPPLNGLRAFAAAGRHLSFRAAAEDLGVTQGAVAQQVRGLEEHLGLRLFLREPRGLAFTEEGRAYHAAVARAFSQLSKATAALRAAPSRVTISVTPTFASKWLIPRLSEFTEAHPGIDLRITATERVSSFHADGIDLAVRQGRPPFGGKPARRSTVPAGDHCGLLVQPDRPSGSPAQRGGIVAQNVVARHARSLAEVHRSGLWG